METTDEQVGEEAIEIKTQNVLPLGERVEPGGGGKSWARKVR